MAISLVGSDQDSQSGSTQVTLNLPTHATDDVGVCAMIARGQGNSGTITGPSGWTELYNKRDLSGTDRVVAAWYKVFTSASETDPAPTFSASDYKAALVGVFRGVDTSTPLEGGTQTGQGQNNNNPSCQAITTSTDDAWIISIGHATHDDITGWGARTSHTMVTSVIAIMSNLGMCYYEKATAGTESATAFNNTDNGTSVADWSAGVIALVPAGAAPASTDKLTTLQNLPRGLGQLVSARLGGRLH